MEFVAKNLFPRVAEGELLNVYNQIWFKHNPPGAPTPSTEGGKLIDTKKLRGTPRQLFYSAVKKLCALAHLRLKNNLR